MSIYLHKVKSRWQPGENTFWYYTFDDQNSSQITDFSWNNRHLTRFIMPTYSLVKWNNYSWNFESVASSSTAPTIDYSSLPNIYTVLIWVKPVENSQSYVSYIRAPSPYNQVGIIRWYNSWQFEYFTESSGQRATIKSNVNLNSWYLIWYTTDWTNVKTYCNWEETASSTAVVWTYWNFYLWSSINWDRFRWEIWACIIESKVWSAEEIEDYYMFTKWDYYPETPWEVNEHTIAYYPLKENFNDASWNNRNLTNTWATITTVDKVTCWYWNGSSYSQYDWYTLWNTARTISAWIYKPSWTWDTWTIHISNYSTITSTWSLWLAGNPTLIATSDWANSSSTINATVSVWWHNAIATQEWNTVKLYVDWVLIWSTTSYPSQTATPNGWCLWSKYYSTHSEKLTWYLSNVILEDKVWSADEVLSYYYQTRNDYIDNPWYPAKEYEVQNIYIGRRWWYRPWVNTLLYLPLDWDYLDKSSNHNDWTAVWTMSFWQIWNRQYASFWASSAIELWTIPVWTWNPQPFTQSVWLKTTASWVWYMHHFWVDSYHSRSCLITFYSSNHIPLQDLYWSSYDTYIWNATTSDLWNKWINLVYTYDNWTHKLYINWELRWTASNTINIWWTTNRYIWRIDASNWWYCMAECIFESVVWSADDVSTYYNKTKEIFYPSKEFVPSQNTLLYLPLENNVSDASWQSVERTFTTSWTSFTTVWWVQSLNVASTWWIKLTAPYPLQDNDKRTNPITVSMLIYVTSQSQSSRRTLFDIAATNWNRQWIVLYENTSNIRMQTSWWETVYATLTAPIIANQWMNIVYTITSSSSKLYVNWELKASWDWNPQWPWGNRPYSRDNTQWIFCTRDVNNYGSWLNWNARELIMEEIEWSWYDVLSYYNWIKEKLWF